MYSILYVLPLACALAVNGADLNLSVELYNQAPDADTFGVILKASHPTLPDDFLGKTPYVCNKDGVWILYQRDSQHYSSWGWINYARGCNFLSIGYSIKSAWFVKSSRNSNVPAVNLFPAEFWSNATYSETFYTERTNYQGNAQSVAVTGSPETTFYTDINFQGRAVCLKVYEHGDSASFAARLHALGLVTGESIKSFRFGCFTENVVVSNITGRK